MLVHGEMSETPKSRAETVDHVERTDLACDIPARKRAGK